MPAGRLTEGMAIMQTGLVAGVAPGATLAGLVIDAHGASAAYLVCRRRRAVAALAAQAAARGRSVPPRLRGGDGAGGTGRAWRRRRPRASRSRGTRRRSWRAVERARSGGRR